MDLPCHLRFSCFPGQHIHLGVTGSIAAYKSLPMIRHLLGAGCSVSATLTDSAQRFITPLSAESLGAHPVYRGMYPADSHVYAHLEPGKTAQALLVAPATANFLAKMAHGIADDMLSCQVLSFPGPCLVAPAMNPALWAAAATQANWRTLLQRGVIPIGPARGDLACGDEGTGRLADLHEIAAATLRAVSPQDLAGARILVSLGPTCEPWDPVRHWTNPSTGLMGASLAMAAWLRGARVTVLRGPVSWWFPPDMTVHDTPTAALMHQAALDLWPGMDIGCLTAAVSDFRPAPHGPGKFKKDAASQGLNIFFEPNPDILYGLGLAKKTSQRLVGFAAETESLFDSMHAKLRRKNLDVIVGNLVGREGSGFGSFTNTIALLDATGRCLTEVTGSKPDLAWRIWDFLLQA